MRSVAICVYGRVQGVGYRYSTKQKAQELGVRGIVKNKLDGSVYIEAEGDNEQIEEFIKWCNKGSEWAYVESVQIVDKPLQSYKTFVVGY